MEWFSVQFSVIKGAQKKSYTKEKIIRSWRRKVFQRALNVALSKGTAKPTTQHELKVQLFSCGKYCVKEKQLKNHHKTLCAGHRQKKRQQRIKVCIKINLSQRQTKTLCRRQKFGKCSLSFRCCQKPEMLDEVIILINLIKQFPLVRERAINRFIYARS